MILLNPYFFEIGNGVAGFEQTLDSLINQEGTPLALNFATGDYRQGSTLTSTFTGLTGYTLTKGSMPGFGVGEATVEEFLPNGQLMVTDPNQHSIASGYGYFSQRNTVNLYDGSETPTLQTVAMTTGGLAPFNVHVVGQPGSSVTLSLPNGSTLASNLTLPITINATERTDSLARFINSSTTTSLVNLTGSTQLVPFRTVSTGGNLLVTPTAGVEGIYFSSIPFGAYAPRRIKSTTGNNRRPAYIVSFDSSITSLPVTIISKASLNVIGNSNRALWAFSNSVGGATTYRCELIYTASIPRIRVTTPGGIAEFAIGTTVEGRDVTLGVTITPTGVSLAMATTNYMSVGQSKTNIAATEIALTNSTAPGTKFYPMTTSNEGGTGLAPGFFKGVAIEQKAYTLAELDKAVLYPTYSRLVPLTTMGINESFFATWTSSHPYRDRVNYLSFRRGSTYDSLPASNLHPVTRLPVTYEGTDTSFRVIFFEGSRSYHNEEYIVNYDPALTLAFEAGSNLTVTQTPSGGVAKFRPTAVGVSTSVTCVISGPLPSSGNWLTCQRVAHVGQTQIHNIPYSDTFAELPTKTIRFMTAQNTNTTLSTPLTSSLLEVNPNRQCSLDFMIGLCNTTNQNLWYCQHDQSDATHAPAVAAYIQSRLNPGLKVYLEWSNETWNSLFPVSPRHQTEGVKAGYWNTAGNATPIATILYPTTSDINPSTGDPTVTYTAGDYISFNRYGFGQQVWQAKIDTVTGSSATLPATGENTYWRVIATNDRMGVAGRRYQAQKSLELFNAFETAFGGTSRLVRVVSGFAGGDTLATVLDRLLWNNLHAKTDMYAFAPYWDSGPLLTGPERDLYATDLPAWLNAIYGKASTAQDNIINRVASLYDEVDSYMQENFGYPTGKIKPGSYELNHHLTLNGAPYTTNVPLAQAAFAAYRADPRFDIETRAYLNKIKTKIGGEHVWFDNIGFPDGTNIQNWSTRRYLGDTAGPGYQGLKGFLENDL